LFNDKFIQKTKTPNCSVSRRLAAADLNQTSHEDRGFRAIFAPLEFFNCTSSLIHLFEILKS